MLKFSRDIEYKDGEEFTLVTAFDIHFGAEHCAEDEFINVLKEHGRKEGHYFIGGGDLLNSIWVVDRRFRFSELHHRYHGNDGFIGDQVEDLADIIIKHTDPEQWLAIGWGNHEDSLITKCSFNPMKRLCERIGYVTLGGYTYYYILNFHQTRDGKKGAGISYIIYVHHGWGGAMRT